LSAPSSQKESEPQSRGEKRSEPRDAPRAETVIRSKKARPPSNGGRFRFLLPAQDFRLGLVEAVGHSAVRDNVEALLRLLWRGRLARARVKLTLEKTPPGRAAETPYRRQFLHLVASIRTLLMCSLASVNSATLYNKLNFVFLRDIAQ
jgi:hypothetical protein